MNSSENSVVFVCLVVVLTISSYIWWWISSQGCEFNLRVVDFILVVEFISICVWADTETCEGTQAYVKKFQH